MSVVLKIVYMKDITIFSHILVHGRISGGGRSIQILLHGSMSEHLFYFGVQGVVISEMN